MATELPERLTRQVRRYLERQAAKVARISSRALTGAEFHDETVVELGFAKGLRAVFVRFWSLRLIRRGLFSIFSHTNSVVMRRLS